MDPQAHQLHFHFNSTSFSRQEVDRESFLLFFLWPVIITFIFTHHHSINASVTIIIIIIICWNRTNLCKDKFSHGERKSFLIECCVCFLYFIFFGTMRHYEFSTNWWAEYNVEEWWMEMVKRAAAFMLPSSQVAF